MECLYKKTEDGKVVSQLFEVGEDGKVVGDTKGWSDDPFKLDPDWKDPNARVSPADQ